MSTEERERRFPVQKQEFVDVKWETAQLAYTEYALQHGRKQSLDRLAERGGFGDLEMINLLVDLIKRQGKELHRLRGGL